MSEKTRRRDPATAGLLGMAVLFPLVRLIGSFFPDERLWGINHAAYINGLWILYPILILAAGWVYLRKDRIERPGAGEIGSSTRGRHQLLLISLIIIQIAAFYLLSVKEYFLGDGHYLIASMANPDIGFKPRGYGEMLLHRFYMEWFWGVNDYYAYLSYRHMSIFAGVIYLATILYYGRKIASSDRGFYAFVALSLTAASVLLFYGYIENYSLLTAALFLFFVSGTAAIQNRTVSLVPVLAYPAAVFLHFMALAYLPAFILYIVISICRKKRSSVIGRYPGIIAIVLSVLVYGLYAAVRLWGPSFWKMAFLSPFGDRFTIDNYALLSAPHLIDYFNLLVFLIPTALILSALWLVKRLSPPADPEEPEFSKVMTFLAAGAATGLTAAFIIEPKLGMARDWDLISVFMIGAVFAGIYAWVTRFGRIRYFLTSSLFLVIVNLSIFIPWLALNNAPKALYDYSISMMELDPKHGRAGFFRMIAYNEGNNHPVEAARLNIYCRETFPEMWLNRDAMGLLAVGEWEEAKRLLDQAREHNPGFFSIYLNQALYFLERRQFDSTFACLNAADALNPYNTFITSFRGLAHYYSGDLDSARAEWLKSIDFDARNSLPFLHLGHQYLSQKMTDSAAAYLRRYPGVSGIYPVYFKLGTEPLMAGDSSTVFDGLEAGLPPADSILSMQLRQIISDLRSVHISGE